VENTFTREDGTSLLSLPPPPACQQMLDLGRCHLSLRGRLSAQRSLTAGSASGPARCSAEGWDPGLLAQL
jgi:hypothetical protein